MKQKLQTLLLTALLGLTGMNAWALDQVDGVYQIGTAQDLVDFATLVNGGTTDANAVLTADIDMTDVSWATPIGDWNTGAVTSAYKGHFDGQGHTITGLTYTTKKNYHGLFGVISTGALIENFTIYGTITSSVATSGVVGYARDATPTIRNVHSYLNINNTRAGSRLGGILGSSVNGTIVVDRCTYSGTMDGNDSGGSGNYGGIVGYVNNNGNAHLRVTNCLFDGELKNSAATPGNCTFGGMVGYVGASPDVTITNCLSLGTLQSAITGLFYGAVKRAACSIVNSYYQGDYNINGAASGAVTPTTQQVTAVTDAQLESGEICYLLNGSVSGGTNWFQTLVDDDYPFPYNGGAHDPIYVNGSYECDGVTPKGTTFYGNTDAISVDDHSFDEGVCSVCGAPDETYMTANAEGIYELGTANQLKWFAALVNHANPAADAVLTADIDLNGVAWTPIGNASVKYTGTFDGQGNAITNFSYTATAQYAGLFGYITTATIKDFSISGTLASDYNYTGMIGCATAAKVSGIHSSLNVTATVHTWVGGVVAGANGAIEIENCSFDGTLSTTGGNAVGGIMGYANTGAIRNCHFNGTLTGNGTVDHLGGILGYVANAGFGGVENCLSTGVIATSSEGTINNGAYLIGNINSNTKLTNIKNNYFLQRDENTPGFAGLLASSAETPHAVTTDQLASGEVCYLLNESTNAGTNWYQTLPGIDSNPTLDSSHGLVYVNGTICPDTGTPQGTVSYSNTEGTSVGNHNDVDGFCSFCGYFNPDFFSAVDGYYQIANGTQFRWFATKVNSGTYSANAVLTDDIDLSGIAWTPIGIGSGSTAPVSTAFTGIFDGQGHSITNFNAEGSGHIGLFGDTNGATIKNFSISGSLTITAGYFGGTVACPANSTIEDVHSALVINVPNSGTHHVAGVVGSARGGNNINKCSFAGSLTVSTGSTDNFAGVVSYLTANDVVENCANYGSVTFSDTGCGAGGVVGYLNDGTVSIKNCLNTGQVLFNGEGSPTYGGAIVGRLRTHTAANVTNHYWLEGSGYGAAKNNSGNIILTTAVEADETRLASGEVTAKLGFAFRQNIGTDTYPVLDATHNVVAEITEAGYATLYLPDTDVTIPTGVDAFTGVLDGEGNLDLESITSKIAADEPVVLKGEAGIYSFAPTTGATKATENDLKGAAEDISVTDDDNKYVLAKPENEPAGFYLVTSGTIKAGRAYLQIDGKASVRGFIFLFDDDADAIENVQWSMVNGQSIFNLAGQRISKMQQGVNIVGGKKFLK